MGGPTLLASRPQFTSERFDLAIEEWDTEDGPIARPIIHHPGAVAVIAQPADHTVLLVRQFRYPIRRWTLEIPAGTRVRGEEPAATAERELAEETGWRCARLAELIRLFPAVGVSDEEMIIYRAEGLRPGEAAPELGELLSAEEVGLTSLHGLARAGEICDAKTLIALALLGQALPRSL